MTTPKSPEPVSARPELWDDHDVAHFCGEIRERYGAHWAFIPSALHNAIVAEMVVRVVTASSLSPGNTVGARDVVSLHRRIKEKLFGDSSV